MPRERSRPGLELAGPDNGAADFRGGVGRAVCLTTKTSRSGPRGGELSADTRGVVRGAGFRTFVHPLTAEPGATVSLVVPGRTATAAHTLVPPNVGVRADSLREPFDAADRRHRPPMVNCTNCGPPLLDHPRPTVRPIKDDPSGLPGVRGGAVEYHRARTDASSADAIQGRVGVTGA
ncbi:hypothetical protein [Streptomyces xanthochromogenes]|uniref:hypothetical protein n=1 Tax=Streptomyces xanthochromogenes TaxID=67384 RepID=UPI00343879B4